jgi:hypothetical protein
MANPNDPNQQPAQQQPVQQQPVQQPPPREREREVIVTDGGRRGGSGAVIAAVLGVLAVILVIWLLAGGLFIGSEGGDATVDVPSEMDVNVDSGDGGEG